MTDDGVVLCLSQVTKSFMAGSASVAALHGVTVSVRRGERVALLGANGAGKTTCLDLICGVTRPTSGTVTALGGEPRRAVKEGRLTAVLQTGGLLRDLTVRETVQVIAGLHRRPERVDVVIEEAGLGALSRRLVGRCSGGEQQRVKYALALIPDPEVLVLDEPAAGLDIEGRAALWDHVRQRAEQGTTIIHSTHHLDEVRDLADRVLLLQKGSLVGDHRVSDLAGPGASMVLTARLGGQSAVERARQELATAILEDSSGGSDLRMVITSGEADGIALRLLRDHGARDLVLKPRTLEDALADLMRKGA